MKKHTWIFSLLSMALCIGVHAEDVKTESISLEKPILLTGGYQGSIKVILETSNGIRASIETDDLILQSVTWNDFENYVALFGDPKGIKKYADGQPWEIKKIQEAMDTWINRWEVQNDPFSAFAVYLKSGERPFIGHVALGHGANPGQAELGFLIKPEYQSKGYGMQAVAAIMFGYAPRLIEDQYLVNMNSEACDAIPLKVVHATTRTDSPHSAQILRYMGLKSGMEEVLWGAPRTHYTIDADEILKNKVLRLQP